MSELVPADPHRCQAEITPAHSPFRLGPPPKSYQCENKPAWIAKETQPGPDGLCGEMSVCEDCVKKLLDSDAHKGRFALVPVNEEKSDE